MNNSSKKFLSLFFLLIPFIVLPFWENTPLKNIGIIGIFSFFLSLCVLNILSSDTGLNAGEIRRSISISVITVFFLLIMFADSIENTVKEFSFLQDIFEHYWWVVMVVIGFYFGGRSGEKIVEKIYDKRLELIKLELEKMNIKKMNKSKRDY